MSDPIEQEIDREIEVRERAALAKHKKRQQEIDREIEVRERAALAKHKKRLAHRTSRRAAAARSKTRVACPKCGAWKASKTAWCPNYRAHWRY